MSIFENLQERISVLFGSKKENKFDSLNPKDDIDYLMNSPIPVGYTSVLEQQFIFQNLISGFNPMTDTLCDIGAGRGDLYKFITDLYGIEFGYIGIDQNPVMVDLAKQKYGLDLINDSYETMDLPEAGWLVTSGIFTTKRNEKFEDDLEYLYTNIDKMYNKATKAVSFNLLCPLAGLVSDGFLYIKPSDVIDTLITKYRFVNIKHDYTDDIYTITIYKF